MTRPSLLTLSLFTCIAAFHATAAMAETCYEQEIVPAHMDCSRNESRSADFVSGCQFVPQETKQVETECEKKTLWVDALGKNDLPTRTPEAVCGDLGLKPTPIDGATCASGLNQPRSGEGWQSIGYPYGVNSKASKVGGVITKAFSITNGGGTNTNSGTRVNVYQCLGDLYYAGGADELPGYSKEQQYAVAIACGS